MSYIIDDIRPTSWHLRVRDEATGTAQDLSFGPDHPWKIGPGSTGVTHGAVPPSMSDALHPFHTFRVGASARLMTVKEIRAMARRVGGKKFAALAEGDARDREAIRLVADTLGGKYEGVGGGPPFADPKSEERWASRPLDANITLRLSKRSNGEVLVGAIGQGAIAWTEAKRTLLGAAWIRDERGAPVATLTDSPTLLAQIHAAHPEVTLDLEGYASPSPETAVSAAARPAPSSEAKTSPTSPTSPAPLTPAPPPPAKANPSASSLAPPPPAKVNTTASSEPAPAPAAKTKAPRKKLKSGKGPGGLTWQRTEDDGNKGLVANWRSGKFKILRASPQTLALFYEYNVGGFQELGCASEPEPLQAVASEWITKVRPGVQVSGACASPAPQAATSPASTSPPPQAPTPPASASPPSPPSPRSPSPPSPPARTPLQELNAKPLDPKSKAILERVTQGLASPGEEGSARKIEDPTGTGVYLPLSVERIDDDRFSLAHYFEQNGDLVPDPDIEFIREKGEWYPAAASLAIGQYRVAIEETEDRRLRLYRQEYRGLVDLAKTMLKNIEQNLLRTPPKPPSPPAESKPAKSPPAESKPAESPPAESKPAKSKPAESPPAEIKPDPVLDAQLDQLFDESFAEVQGGSR